MLDFIFDRSLDHSITLTNAFRKRKSTLKRLFHYHIFDTTWLEICNLLLPSLCRIHLNNIKINRKHSRLFPFTLIATATTWQQGHQPRSSEQSKHYALTNTKLERVQLKKVYSNNTQWSPLIFCLSVCLAVTSILTTETCIVAVASLSSPTAKEKKTSTKTFHFQIKTKKFRHAYFSLLHYNNC